MSNIETIIAKVSSLCSDNNVKFTYHHDPKLLTYTFRFKKYSHKDQQTKGVGYMISEEDIENKQPNIVMREIYYVLDKLYDAVAVH